MPLVTRDSTQANVFIGTSATASNMGDMWVNTSTFVISVWNGSAWVPQTAGALGSALNTLRVDSGATGLEFTVPAGAWNKIKAFTLAGGQLSATSLTAYDCYMILFALETDTNSASMLMQINSDTGGNYCYSYDHTGAITYGTAQTSIITGSFVPARKPNYVGQIIMWSKFSSIDNSHAGTIDTTCMDSGGIAGGGVDSYFKGNFEHYENAVITSVLLKPSAGNFATASKAIIFGRNMT